jgi:uncharacterized protein YqgC (DUF456 family)
MNWLRSQPALAGAIASLIGVVIGIFVDNPQLAVALGGVFLAFVGVRQVVTPVTTAATKITEAATQAATKTVEQLDETVVGTTGEVTDAARDIVTSTVREVVGGLL